MSKISGTSVRTVKSLFSSLPNEIKSHSIRVGLITYEMTHFCDEKYGLWGCSDKNVFMSAVLDGGQYHDIGKIMLSYEILIKGDNLSEIEKTVIKRHPAKTAELLLGSFEADDADYDAGYKGIVLDMGKYHHEKVDGSGYPYCLGGQDIPLISRMCSIADCFDNSVRKGKECEKAKELILSQKDISFYDEEIEIFLKAYPNITELYYNKTERGV